MSLMTVVHCPIIGISHDEYSKNNQCVKPLNSVIMRNVMIYNKIINVMIYTLVIRHIYH